MKIDVLLALYLLSAISLTLAKFTTSLTMKLSKLVAPFSTTNPQYNVVVAILKSYSLISVPLTTWHAPVVYVVCPGLYLSAITNLNSPCKVIFSFYEFFRLDPLRLGVDKDNQINEWIIHWELNLFLPLHTFMKSIINVCRKNIELY